VYFIPFFFLLEAEAKDPATTTPSKAAGVSGFSLAVTMLAFLVGVFLRE
jgi:hypothetical protein